MKPIWRRLPLLLASPFTLDVLPMIGCRSCGFNAPIRKETRDAVVKWGVILLVLQDGTVPMPMASFGVGGEFGQGGKYDNGERFDLRLRFADQGWVGDSRRSWARPRVTRAAPSNPCG